MGSTLKHLSINIDLLLGKTDKELHRMWPEYTGREIRADLEERKKNGHRLIGSPNCKGFDPVNGCPGHRVKKKEVSSAIK